MNDPDTTTAPLPESEAPLTFEELGVSAELVTALKEHGIEAPFAIQRLSIADALAGRDVCGKAKTGSGKTLAFGLPLLQRLAAAEPRKPRGLVLVPTRELALQVHDVLAPLAESVGSRIVAVYGGADMNKQIKKLAAGVEAIIATPGRLIDLVERKEVELNGLEIVVVDEADRMADMGFLPQVEWLLRHVDTQHQTLLFSATLDGVVDGLIKRYQHDPVYHEVASQTVTVDAMIHRFIGVHEMDKVKVAAAIARGSGRVLAFTNTKRVADRLARSLNEEGVKAAAIHGDLRQGQREDALKDFGAGKIKVMVATDVAARGLHIDDVDVVIHYDPAPDHKTYLHRSGRTARAGSKGMAVSLSIWNEELHMKRLQKRIGVIQPITEMFSNDPRLADLTAWEPSAG
ncbi:MAG TPA: DEAD/DEAH box helicase [Acidimicrobiales bacterium]|nr:DEAD/DEAH box helicase [Acidimicrobiales bacterium]